MALVYVLASQARLFRAVAAYEREKNSCDILLTFQIDSHLFLDSDLTNSSGQTIRKLF